MDGKVLVVTHKPYRMPKDPLYLPIQVGAGPSLGHARDNTGKNIAAKNVNYCELTALYWGWQNLPDASFLGLAHYRRHFALLRRGDKWRRVLRREEAERLLSEKPVWVPRPRHYWIETNESQYIHAHHAVDLARTREILSARHPEYLEAYDKVMRRSWGHRFNMFIMRRDLADAYCEWLFDVLFALEGVLDISGYSTNDARVFGFVSERLLDVWLTAEGIAYGEIPVMFMERENWVRKGFGFLKRKVGIR